MATRVKDIHSSDTVRRIISRFVPEQLRLSRTAKLGHLQSLAAQLGVKRLMTRPLSGIQDQHPGVDAMLVPLPNGYSVVINENAPHTRQRYSLAHELGHIMLLTAESSTLSPTAPTRFRSSASATKNMKAEERLCDAIAAELLMPETMFSSAIEDSRRSLKQLPRLAGQFGTSLTATAIRYWELLPEPCYLIKWSSPARRQGVIVPAWQMRNKVPGPYLRPVMDSSRADSDEFRTVRETWKTLRTSISRESLLVEYSIAGRHYVRTTTFETESIGFGSRNNRTVLSAVYLGRTCEDS